MKNEKLNILWTTGDREVALNMILMYAVNAKLNSWWPEISLIIWGPSAALAAKDQEIQQYLKKCLSAGVEIKACKACADRYEVSAKLRELGVEVIYMGKPLTAILQENEKLITL